MSERSTRFDVTLAIGAVALALLTVLVTTVPLIMCGLGLLINVVVSRTRRGSYDEASATY